MAKLLAELALAKGDGSYPRLMSKLARAHVLVLDDWALAPLPAPEARELWRAENPHDLKAELEEALRQRLLFRAAVELVPKGRLTPRGGMKSQLVIRGSRPAPAR